jgi:osmotically-inducible protein OsmY
MDVKEAPPVVLSDTELQLAVVRGLQLDPRVDATDIGVEVDEGVVTLTGSVPSFARKQAADRAAHRVPGVLDVADEIQVKVPSMLARTDTDVALSVRRALAAHRLVPNQWIQTTVADGHVTLDGTVDTPYQREAAERAILGLPGVRAVVNNLATVSTSG